MANLKSERRVVVNSELSRERKPVFNYTKRGQRVETPRPRLVVARKGVAGVPLPADEPSPESAPVRVELDSYPHAFRPGSRPLHMVVQGHVQFTA